MEEWAVIEEAPNYLVSNEGHIKNSNTGRILKGSLNLGYPSVNLMNQGKVLNRRVHRLVAIYFVQGYAPGLEVRPIDGNKENCRSDNLEWLTRYQNANQSNRASNSRILRSWEYDPVTGIKTQLPSESKTLRRWEYDPDTGITTQVF